MTQQSDFTKQPSGLAKSFPELSELVELFPGLSELAKLFAATAIVIVLLTLVLLKTNALDPKHIELVGGIIGGLALFVGGVWAVLTYANNKRLEFQKNFNERQVDVVLEAASAAGNLIAGQGRRNGRRQGRDFGNCIGDAWFSSRMRPWSTRWSSSETKWESLLLRNERSSYLKSTLFRAHYVAFSSRRMMAIGGFHLVKSLQTNRHRQKS
jgi:hypothetical protein